MKALKIFYITLLFVLIAGNVFAQRVQLTVEASEGPAQIILDGRMLGMANPNFRAQVSPGTYDLIVRKPGLPEFRQRITVGSVGLNVKAQLGGSPAPQPIRFSLKVISNISGAEVYINNSKMGNVPLERSLSSGEYNLRITSPGFQDYFAKVNLNKNRNVVANLQPLMAKLSIVLPSKILNQNINRPESKVDLYINGYKVNGLTAQMEPGEHQIQIISGGLSFETTINVQPGEQYTIQPVVSFQLK